MAFLIISTLILLGTVSVGVATIVPANNDEGALFDAADAALYKAKGRGRNCVEGPILNA